MPPWSLTRVSVRIWAKGEQNGNRGGGHGSLYMGRGEGGMALSKEERK